MPHRESTVLPHDHAVIFYDDDAELVTGVADFIVAGVGCDEPAIVVATAEHRGLIDETLVRLGLDLATARTTGRLVMLDAEATLSTFLRDGILDAAGFGSTVGTLIDSAAAGGRRVRVFGEMVALLWQGGNVAGALELEAMWNGLAMQRWFTLLCAYPLSVLGDAPLDDVERVCDVHSSLTPPRSYISSNANAPALRAEAGHASKVFVCVPAAVPAVRRFVAKTLSDWGCSGVIADAVLVASELATNAVRHTQSPFRVTLDRTGASVRIAVEDLSRSYPALHRQSGDATWGRGVFIVDDVSRAWGTEPLPLGKVVWADLRAHS